MAIEQAEFLSPNGVEIVPPVLPPSEPTRAELAERWMHSPGGRHIMRDLYAMAAGYAHDWRRTGIPISCKLLFEVERHKIKCVKARCQRRGVTLDKDHGYTLNNDRTAYIARHMMDRRPEWKGLFETRELRDET